MVCRLVPRLLVCRTDEVHPALLRSMQKSAIASLMFFGPTILTVCTIELPILREEDSACSCTGVQKGLGEYSLKGVCLVEQNYRYSLKGVCLVEQNYRWEKKTC
ncbi:hypothetical protein Tco_0233909 [Tanacetum coccineum]